MIQRCHHSTARSVEGLGKRERRQKQEDSLTFSGWQFCWFLGAEMHSKLKSKLNRPDLPQARSRLGLLAPWPKECTMQVEIPMQMSSISTRIETSRRTSERCWEWTGKVGVFELRKNIFSSGVSAEEILFGAIRKLLPRLVTCNGNRFVGQPRHRRNRARF